MDPVNFSQSLPPIPSLPVVEIGHLGVPSPGWIPMVLCWSV